MRGANSIATGLVLVLVAGCSTVSGDGSSDHPMAMSARLPGACEEPAAANEGKLGCYFDVELQLINTSRELYWHIEEFTDPIAAEAAKGPAGVVVTAYGRPFLYTVNGNAQFATRGARLVSTIGPLPAPAGQKITARFMQAMTERGAMTRVHTHDGPEAFYLLSGAICMDSPGGPVITGSGQTYWIGGNVPMQLHHSGDEVRRSLFVVLHPSPEPWMRMSEWTPTGGCNH